MKKSNSLRDGQAQAGIKISDMAAVPLEYLFEANSSNGPRLLLRQLLEDKHRQNVSRKEGIGALLQEARREIDELEHAANTSNIWTWRNYVKANPPSAEAIALMLDIHEKRVQSEGARAVGVKERARTEKATAAIKAKADKGNTLEARAHAELETRRKNGDNIMGRSVAGEIANRLGCDPATVRNARKKLLTPK